VLHRLIIQTCQLKSFGSEIILEIFGNSNLQPDLSQVPDVNGHRFPLDRSPVTLSDANRCDAIVVGASVFFSIAITCVVKVLNGHSEY
jgi:hypothetical protein